MTDHRERYKPKYRQPERDAKCRVCSKTIQRDADWMVSWYTSQQQGQYIHICPDCVKVLYELIPE